MVSSDGPAILVRTLRDQLVAGWREMSTPGTIARNVGAGVVVAMIAIPLNLALALACDLPASAGLVSGAVAGLVGSLLGGTRLSITGPEVALAPLTALIVAAHGIDGMLVATAIAGLLQIAFGALGAGRLVRLVPRPVVGGFLAAAGLMVFDSQVPHLVGVHDGSRIAGVAAGLSDFALHSTSIAIGLSVIVVVVLLPRVAPRVPAPLVGLALAIGLVGWLGLPLERVTPISDGASLLRLPDPSAVDLVALLPSALALAVLASIDSLLCAVAIDARLGTAHESDRELVAQGIANLACAFIGGMPVAAAIVRSTAAIEAGGSTRLAGVVQSLVLGAVVLALGAHLGAVPLAALAGVLLVVGAKLVEVRELSRLARVRRFDAVVFVVTAIAIVATGFVEGLLVGTGVAMLGLVREQSAALRATVDDVGARERVVRMEGPLVFSSQHRASELLRDIASGAHELVVELGRVTHWDASGLAALRGALAGLRARGARIRVEPGDAIPATLLARELGDVAHVPGAWPDEAASPVAAGTRELVLESAE